MSVALELEVYVNSGLIQSDPDWWELKSLTMELMNWGFFFY